MPSLIDKLLGKRARTSKNIAAEIEAQVSGVAACHTRREAAKSARQAAIEDFDDAAHKAADEAIAAAGREFERREHALVLLRVAHGERVEMEKREDYRREVREAKEAEAALHVRVMREYESAARTIASVMSECAKVSYKRTRLLRLAGELGETPPDYIVRHECLHLGVGDLPSPNSPEPIHTGMAAHLAR